jgi:hypothetical protein
MGALGLSNRFDGGVGDVSASVNFFNIEVSFAVIDHVGIGLL